MASGDVCCTLPKMTWSMSSGATRACAIAALDASTARSVAERSFNMPPKVPKAVRFAPRIQISRSSFFAMAVLRIVYRQSDAAAGRRASGKFGDDQHDDHGRGAHGGHQHHPAEERRGR